MRYCKKNKKYNNIFIKYDKDTFKNSNIDNIVSL